MPFTYTRKAHVLQDGQKIQHYCRKEHLRLDEAIKQIFEERADLRRS